MVTASIGAWPGNPRWPLLALGVGLGLVSVLIFAFATQLATNVSTARERHREVVEIKNLRIAVIEMSLALLSADEPDPARYRAARTALTAKFDAAKASPLPSASGELVGELERLLIESPATFTDMPANGVKVHGGARYSDTARRLTTTLDKLEREYQKQEYLEHASLTARLFVTRMVLVPAVIVAYALALLTLVQLARENRRRAVTMAALQREVDAAASMSLTRANFLASTSHEIRNPITSILGMSGLALATQLTPAQRDYLEAIRYAGQSALRVVDDLLTLGKGGVGELNLKIERFDLTACVEEISRRYAARAAVKSINFSYHIDNSVPRRMLGDPTRIAQVLENLIDNAVRFTHQGTVRLEITEIARWQGRIELEFVVSDTGVGIGKAQRNRIFALPAIQADSPAGGNGVGLGLAICAGLVALMGGRIDFESVEGKGSTVRFTALLELAAERRKERPPAPANTTASNDVNLGLRHPLRVLIADDSSLSQQVFLELLRLIGYEADISCDGIEAVEAIKRRPYDLVFMNVKMPRMDGLEATRRILSALPADYRPCVIGVTMGAVESEGLACTEAGMDGYIQKPLTPARIADAIHIALARANAMTTRATA